MRFWGELGVFRLCAASTTSAPTRTRSLRTGRTDYPSFMVFTGWPSEVTPRDMAGVLEISEKTLRAWLRRNPHVIHAHSERWVVGSDEADKIVEAYGASRR